MPLTDGRRLTGLDLQRAYHEAAAKYVDAEYGSDVDEVAFPEAVRLMPVVSADHHLNELLVTYCEEALAHRRPGSVTLRSSVENAIAPVLPHGKARAEEIARQLGMSQRTFARRLSSEGLTFSNILDELKLDVAKCYLKNDELPISQIAWLLGYRELSAFRRWTGMTPRQWRGTGDLERMDDLEDRRPASQAGRPGNSRR